ncbi:hypothetical protein X970_12075 [Pseudomonas monteilii SB3101]|uniref:Uncharacterized protein n=1 Tax=Pseudomonas monteilii SB3101 TaxID=1435058 RepID=V9VB21_9PSED|nr:hypothetical protein [Pseudomonas monteilii]AHC85745.1 hypothetical protein X969_12430 [Pseudomonas monteilii SB3078]AHC91105.1 hypothetical protein X970_12075 [Pseudomonas monteilii SB3101]
MLLVKSCERKHNIKNGTIKVGTLYEYREIEDDDLIDSGEGMLTFTLNFHGKITISKRWFDLFDSGFIQLDDEPVVQFPGRTKASFERLEIVNISSHGMDLLESSAILARESLNSFVFCMSRVKREVDAIEVFPKYDDCWAIQETKSKEFAAKLARMIGRYIVQQHSLGNYILPAETDCSKLGIQFIGRRVEYLSREIDLYDRGLVVLEDFESKLENMAFIKPESYSKECEYRFNFVAIVNGEIVEPIVKSVFLVSTPLLGLVL